MIKKKIQKIICTAIATGMVIGVTPICIAEAATNEVINSSKENLEISENDLPELTYAVEEMREAITLVDNANFTEKENYDRLVVFSKSSLDRLRSLGVKNKYAEWIEESGNEVRALTYRIDRVLHAIDNVKVVFSEERKDTLENKENVINTLNLVIYQESESRVLNKITLDKAKEIYNNYYKEFIEESKPKEVVNGAIPKEDENKDNKKEEQPNNEENRQNNADVDNKQDVKNEYDKQDNKDEENKQNVENEDIKKVESKKTNTEKEDSKNENLENKDDKNVKDTESKKTLLEKDNKSNIVDMSVDEKNHPEDTKVNSKKPEIKKPEIKKQKIKYNSAKVNKNNKAKQNKLPNTGKTPVTLISGILALLAGVLTIKRK
ncbi:hypothetical protein [Clostridium septicum]|uniref:Gram-positive cocci surface proteins LPxTG domain-containing protein n=1 Tax=Clostridium septicum TaxID=1504 RepID=A0A9N7JM65_CLOSE|nr:hypothetical protein [Clostridium septicum]AYE35189.1 hypothetical protein CP523_12575 [Clostridium septicum]QAS60593.1 hypothetical protein EI377_07475 [Clostridium septicum]UEC20160.1 hypothetical protein LK444_12225 [Clostridium septicum]USS01785.1 hypothetical protein NH397_04960 [Clostridium septicum]